MAIVTVGIDLAKNIFAVHCVNESGHTELVKPRVSRDQLLPLIAHLPPCTIGHAHDRMVVTSNVVGKSRHDFLHCMFVVYKADH